MQSGPAPKPMAVTVYRLTTCPHCNAANGVTAIRCWSCDQPLADKRWTGEVPAEELAPAREPSLTDTDFSFLDDDLHARQKKAAVEDAVATARTFASTRALGHTASAMPSLPHRPQVVERLEDGQSSWPSSAPSPLSSSSRPPRPSGPVPSALEAPLAWPPRQEPEARALDQPLDFDQPLPFADAGPSSRQPKSADMPRLSHDEAPSPFSVRHSATGETPGAAFRKGRRVEAIVLTVVLGAGLYAYLQPSSAPSLEDGARLPATPGRTPAIDAETQRLLDLSAPATSTGTPAAAPAAALPASKDRAPTPAPALSSSPAPSRAPPPAQPPPPAPAPTRAPAAAAVQPVVPSPAPAARPAPSPSPSPASPVPPRSAEAALVAPVARILPAPSAPPVEAAGTAARSDCAPHVAAMGLC